MIDAGCDLRIESFDKGMFYQLFAAFLGDFS